MPVLMSRSLGSVSRTASHAVKHRQKSSTAKPNIGGISMQQCSMLHMTASQNGYTVSLNKNQLARSAAQASLPCDEFVLPTATMQHALCCCHTGGDIAAVALTFAVCMLSVLNCCLHADPPQGWLSRSTALLGMCNYTCCMCKLASRLQPATSISPT